MPALPSALDHPERRGRTGGGAGTSGCRRGRRRRHWRGHRPEEIEFELRGTVDLLSAHARQSTVPFPASNFSAAATAFDTHVARGSDIASRARFSGPGTRFGTGKSEGGYGAGDWQAFRYFASIEAPAGGIEEKTTWFFVPS